MDRLWQNVKDVTRSVTVVRTLKTLVALIVIVLITGAYGMSKALQTNKIELTKTRLVNQMANIFNNAGNIEVGQGFAGETGETYANDRTGEFKPFVVFDTPQMGMRAIFRDIRHKIKKHDGILWNIVSEYAPPSENNTEIYFKKLQRAVNGETMINETHLLPIVRAIITHENKPEVSNYYLQDKNLIKEAYQLSTMSFPSDTSYKEATEIYRQEPLHLSHHVPKDLK
jgi:hypothetical protein